MCQTVDAVFTFSTRDFDLCLLSKTQLSVLWGTFSCPLSGDKRLLISRRLKYIISTKSIKCTSFVCCMGAVCISESPSWEVPL